MGKGKLDPFHDSPWVHKAIKTVIDSLSSVPFVLRTGDDDDPTDITSGPWYDFFLRPTSDYTRREFWRLTWNYTQIGSGEAFWILHGRLGPRGDGEIPVEAQVLAGDHFEDKSGPTGRLDHWLYRPGGSASSIRLEPWQVVQFAPCRDPNRPRRGLAPLDPLLLDIETDNRAAQWNKAVLENGARPDGILITDQEITAAQAESLRTRWRDMHAGAEKAGNIGVLGSGAKWQDVTMNHKEMGFQQSREWARQAISAVYGVPLMLMGVLEDVHKETSRQVRKLFWETTLLPMLRLAEDLLEARLFPEGMWGAFDLANVEALSEEEGERRENAMKDRALGLPLNQIITRYDLGYEDQGDSGDVGLVSLALQTVDEAAMVDEYEPESPPPAASATPPAPPSPPGDNDASNAEGEEGEEDEEGRAASTRRNQQRVADWQGYVRTVLRPPEKSMQKAVSGWIRGRRADVLRWLGKARSAGHSVRAIDDDEVSGWLASQRERWHDLLAKQTRRADTLAVELSLARAASQIGELQVIDMQHPRILELLEFRGGQKIRAVETMQQNIRRGLLEGASQSETIAELQERVRGVFKVEASRAQTIARTETAAAASQAKEEVFEAEGIESTSWLSAGDGEERESHAAVDGEVRRRGKPFSNGLMYPHDPNGPAKEVINCRCDALPEV